MILASNLPFGRVGEVFGNQTIAAAIIDQLVHYRKVHPLTGDSCRTRERNVNTRPSEKPENKTQ